MHLPALVSDDCTLARAANFDTEYQNRFGCHRKLPQLTDTEGHPFASFACIDACADFRAMSSSL